MTEKNDTNKKKKTLSLKLGSKPKITQKRSIEVGKTVIVEKKGIRKGLVRKPNQ